MFTGGFTCIITLLRQLSDNESDSGDLSSMHDESDNENVISVALYGLEMNEDIEIEDSQNRNEVVTHSIKYVLLKVEPNSLEFKPLASQTTHN